MKRISHTNHSLLRSIIAAVLALGCFVSPLLAASAFADGWYCPSCGRNDDGYFCPKDGIRKPSGLDSTSVGGVSKYDAKDLDAVYAPVDLTSLTPYFEGVIDAFTDGIKDTMGNTYRTGIRGYMSSSDGSRFDCFHIWDIDPTSPIVAAESKIKKTGTVKSMSNLPVEKNLLYEKKYDILKYTYRDHAAVRQIGV